MDFWSLLSTAEEGGIRPARRRAGGLKGASVSDLNAKDGAITSIEGQRSCLVCCCVYVRLSTLWVFHLRFSFFWTGHGQPCLYDQINFTLLWRMVFSFQPLLHHAHNAIFKCAFLAAWCSLAICSSSSLTLRTSPDWWGCGLVLFICISGNDIHIVCFSEQKLSRFSVWYLGLDFLSRLLFLRGKSQLLWAVIFLGGNLFLFYAARVLDQALNALKQKCFGPQPFTPSALLYVIE